MNSITNYSISNNTQKFYNTNFKAGSVMVSEPIAKDMYKFGESAIDKLIETIKTPLTKNQTKALNRIDSQNKVFTQMLMDMIFNDNFQTRKEILLKELSGLAPSSILEKIESAANSRELSSVLERFQTGMIIDVETKAMKLNTVKDLGKEISKEWEVKMQKTDSINTAIQRALIVKTNIPEIKQMEEVLLKDYGVKVSLGNNLEKANKIFEACNIWLANGEKLPEEIIVSQCMPMYGCGGQALNSKVVVYSDNKLIDTLYKIAAKLDKLKFLHIIPPTYSTSSEFHVYIHELAHTVQPKALRNENIELPKHLQKAAKKVSKYATGGEGLSELYAELKTKSILAKDKMTKQQTEILEFLESLK